MSKRKRELENEEVEILSEVENFGGEEITQQKMKRNKKEKKSSHHFHHSALKHKLGTASGLNSSPHSKRSEQSSQVDELIQRILTHSIERSCQIEESTLYEDLRNARLNHEDKVLIITSQDEHPGEMPRFPKEIYMQSQYEDVYNMIQQRFFRSKNESPCKDFIVLGNPGIGKTIFGLYFMWKLVSSSTLFMYEARKDKIRLYLPGYVISINRDQADELCMVFRREIVYLVDLAESHVEADATIVYKYAVVFTSPNPSKYKYFAKGNEARILYMKRPTVDEVKDMWRYLNTFNHIDEKVIDKQLKRFGPIPRYVLFPQRYDKRFFSDVIQSKGEVVCRTLLDRLFRLERDDTDRSFTLIHMDSDDH